MYAIRSYYAILLGLTADKMVGQPLEKVVPEMAGLMEGARRLRGGHPVEAEVRVQQEKETRTLLTRVSVERDGDQIIGYVVTFDDVSVITSYSIHYTKLYDRPLLPSRTVRYRVFNDIQAAMRIPVRFPCRA